MAGVSYGTTTLAASRRPGGGLLLIPGLVLVHVLNDRVFVALAGSRTWRSSSS
jgi:hypothetical protein